MFFKILFNFPGKCSTIETNKFGIRFDKNEIGKSGN